MSSAAHDATHHNASMQGGRCCHAGPTTSTAVCLCCSALLLEDACHAWVHVFPQAATHRSCHQLATFQGVGLGRHADLAAVQHGDGRVLDIVHHLSLAAQQAPATHTATDQLPLQQHKSCRTQRPAAQAMRLAATTNSLQLNEVLHMVRCFGLITAGVRTANAAGHAAAGRLLMLRTSHRWD